MILNVKLRNHWLGLDLLICGAQNAHFLRTLKRLQFIHAISAISWYSYAYGYVFATPTRNPWPRENSMSPWTLTLAPWLLLIDLWPSALDPWQLTHEQPALSPEPWALSPGHAPWALGPDQDDAIMSKSHKLMDKHWISNTKTAPSLQHRHNFCVSKPRQSIFSL